MKYSIHTISQQLQATLYGSGEGGVDFLLTDSRSLCFPETTLFFALPGNHNDGHCYIAELYARGVKHFVVERLPDSWEQNYPLANFLCVPSTLQALQHLAAVHRQQFDIPVVAITGSNGKTMVKEWLYQLISPEKVVTRSPRSYNSQIGVPLSVWLINRHTQLALFEAGISMSGEMQALQQIIKPSIVVVTNIGAPHQENFPSVEAKCREKLILCKDSDTLVYCADDPVVKAEIVYLQPKAKTISWSMFDKQADLYVENVEKQRSSVTIAYRFGDIRSQFTLPYIDDASIANALTCTAVALHLKLSPNTLAERIARLEPVAMRLEVKRGINGCTLINDAYNSDINSLHIALDFMWRRPDQYQRCKTLILSDIDQSGMPEDKLYREVSRIANKRGVTKFIGIGTSLCQHQSNISLPQCHFFPSVEDFLHSKTRLELHNEVILLKGARRFGFERIVDILSQKVHETTLEVNLSALVDNLNHYRSLMQPHTKLICMIKANGYGAGAVEIAKTLQDRKVDYLAVAVADEGATLRRAGITGNIMVMNPEMAALQKLFDYELEPEIYSFRLLEAFIRAAEKAGITDYPVHIKLDTGMHRLGFDPQKDMPALIKRLHTQNAIMPKSVFSHFVGADADIFDDFSQRQYQLFTQGADLLQAAFDHHILRHIDNSAGIEHFPERQLDMCRLGIGLYGINPRTNTLLHNVCTLKTTLLQIRSVSAEETVGYSRKGIVHRDSRIAAIPIGYADGLHRALGNGKAYCLVNGKQAPYVGNICMDVAMIDVTDIACQEGDVVEVFGDNLPITVLSDAMQTIPYEILTGISDRVKRVYFQD